MKINTYVELKTFLGTEKGNEIVAENENYWKLIGEKGEIISEKNDKFLVLFDKNLDELNLENHNPIDNSLWISKSDLNLSESKA